MIWKEFDILCDEVIIKCNKKLNVHMMLIHIELSKILLNSSIKKSSRQFWLTLTCENNCKGYTYVNIVTAT